jgi:hypothetical protein
LDLGLFEGEPVKVFRLGLLCRGHTVQNRTGAKNESGGGPDASYGGGALRGLEEFAEPMNQHGDPRRKTHLKGDVSTRLISFLK